MTIPGTAPKKTRNYGSHFVDGGSYDFDSDTSFIYACIDKGTDISNEAEKILNSNPVSLAIARLELQKKVQSILGPIGFLQFLENVRSEYFGTAESKREIRAYFPEKFWEELGVEETTQNEDNQN